MVREPLRERPLAALILARLLEKQGLKEGDLAWISTDRNWANADGLGAIGRGAGIGLATTGL